MKLLDVYKEYMKLCDQYDDPVFMIGMNEKGIYMATVDALTFKQWLESRGGAITGYYREEDGECTWLYGKIEDVQIYTLLDDSEVNIDLCTIREFKEYGGVINND